VAIYEIRRIKMANTAEELRIRSENLKNGIAPLLQQIVTTNLEIAKKIEENNSLIERANANIEQLYRDNDELAVLKGDNETFISKVEEILGK
jgi:hypothetical protein